MSNIVGIDLGTTYSAISKLNILGKPEIIPNAEGQRITASALYFGEDKTYSGETAKNMSKQDDSRFADDFKRDMGAPVYHKSILGEKKSPIALSAKILEKLKIDFEKKEGKIDKAIISVPAYFTDEMRTATKEAALQAGLPCIGLINEPTAAAIYYATEFNIPGTSLVFDLGGGTFDITLLEVNGNDVTVISSDGDHRLGGKDFDQMIVEDMKKVYQTEKGVPLFDTGEKTAENDFRLRAELIKKTLSNTPSTTEIIYGDRGRVDYKLDRNHFNKIIATYIAKMEMKLENLMIEADINEIDVDNIILVGGSTRIPLVTSFIRDMFNKEPMTLGNVDECVALGASISCGLRVLESSDAHLLSRTIQDQLGQVNLTDVCNHSFGTLVVVRDPELGEQVKINDILIPKNTKLPYTITKTYVTAYQNQPNIDVSVTQGESKDPEDVNILVEKYMDLPAGRPQGSPIEITYTYDINQIMHCKFVEVESGHVEEVTIEGLEESREKAEDDFSAFLDF